MLSNNARPKKESHPVETGRLNDCLPNENLQFIFTKKFKSVLVA